MKYGKIYTYKDTEETTKLIGKKVLASDCFRALSDKPNDNYPRFVLQGINKASLYPFLCNGEIYQFIREIEEETPQRMTNLQIAEWVTGGNGLIKYQPSNDIGTNFLFTGLENEIVRDGIMIRPLGSNDWVEPTVDIYERDCKGVKIND